MRLASAVLLAASLLAPIEALDQSVRRVVQEARRPALEGPMRTLTAIGRPVLVLGALAVIAVVDRPAGLGVARDALLALAPTNLVVEGLKRSVGRVRPDGDAKRSNSAFPSSHAANAFALAVVLARRWRRAAWGLYPFAAAVAFSRMYLDRHWCSDVVAGALLGALCAVAVLAWTGRWGSRTSGMTDDGRRTGSP